jgi:hypothetical protein
MRSLNSIRLQTIALLLTLARLSQILRVSDFFRAEFLKIPKDFTWEGSKKACGKTWSIDVGA